jgi:hypothetical protein
MFFVSPRSDTLFVMLSLAELSWFPYRIMTLWTSLSAFIYELLLPSRLRLLVAGTRKSAVNGHPFRSSGIPVQALFSHASSSWAAVSGSCCFHTTTGLIHTCHPNRSRPSLCICAVHPCVWLRVCHGFFSRQNHVLPRAITGATRRPSLLFLFSGLFRYNQYSTNSNARHCFVGPSPRYSSKLYFTSWATPLLSWGLPVL